MEYTEQNIEHFFLHLLPAMMVRNCEELISQPGILCFSIGATQRWTIEFGSLEPVVRGAREECDLFLKFTPGAFGAFVSGTLDFSDAFAKREVSAAGTEYELLERFGRVLSPPSQRLGWSAE
jgi:hypothetical protein